MRLRFARTFATILLITCLVCPLVEMFDRWDHTIQTGNDSEYALVLLALCLGAAYSLTRFIVNCLVAGSSTAKVACASSVQMPSLSAELSFSSLFPVISSHTLELRI
jgi:hypothetical protein